MSQGRDEQLVCATLVHATRPRVCTLVGSAGIGKSELLRRVRRRWRDDDRDVVRIVGGELDQHTPLAGVDQLLDRLGHTGLDLVAPEHADGSVEENVERRVAGLVLRELDRLAAANTLVVIDDAHWLDETSRRVLDFALRRLDDESPPTLIAERPGRPLTNVGERLQVSGLSLEESGAVIRAHAAEHGDPLDSADRIHGPDDAVVTTLHELAGGHPLALGELLAARSGPSEFGRPAERNLIRRRLDPLDRHTRCALAMLARRRLGDDLEAAWRTLGHLRQGDIGVAFDDALRPAIDAGLVRAKSSRVSAAFPHPEYRSVAAHGVDGDLGRAISEALAETTTEPDSAAWHRADASPGLDDEVAALLAGVGRRTAERGLPLEAGQAFEAAAAHSSDPATVIDRRIDAATSWWLAGEIREVERVTAGGDELPVDLLRRVRIRRFHRSATGWQGNVESTVRGLLDDADLIDDASLDDACGLRLVAFIEACHGGYIDQAVAIAAGIEERIVGAGADADADESWAGVVAVCRAFASLLAGHVDGADDAPELVVFQLAASLEPKKLDTAALNVLQLVGYALMVLERWDEAASTLSGLATEERRRGATIMSEFTEGSMAELDRRRGRWASASSRCTDDPAFDPDRRGDVEVWQRVVRARMLAYRGEPRAVDFIDSVYAEAGPAGMASLTSGADVALATHLIGAGRHDEAAEVMAALERRTVERGALEPDVLWHDLDAIEAFDATGRTDDLRRVVERLERASGSGRRWPTACARLGRLLLDGTVSSDAVVDAATELGDAIEAVRVRLLTLEHVAVTDPPRVGLEQVDELRRGFARFGARPFVERCESLAARLRMPSPTDTPTETGQTRPTVGSDAGRDAPTDDSVLTVLTPAELRVAVSVAAGNTNAESADELFLSVRTVEAHLRAIFRKLDVRNRVELATAMIGHVSD